MFTPVEENVVAKKIDNDKFVIIADQCQLSVRTQDTDKWVEILNREYQNSLNK